MTFGPRSMLIRLRNYIQVQRLSPLARAVRAERLTYLSPARLLHIEGELKRALKQTDRGSVMEFGIALGGSAIVLAQHARDAGRSFSGFDVFGLIPEPTSDKDDQKSKARYEVIKSGQSKGLGDDTYYGYRANLYEDVCASFRRHGLSVDGQTIALHKGLFQETLPLLPAEPVAFAHIDADWYDPVKFCLEHLAERVVPGGTIMLDDYHDYGGCRMAADEFLASRRDFTLHEGSNVSLRKS